MAKIAGVVLRVEREHLVVRCTDKAGRSRRSYKKEAGVFFFLGKPRMWRARLVYFFVVFALFPNRWLVKRRLAVLCVV